MLRSRLATHGIALVCLCGAAVAVCALALPPSPATASPVTRWALAGGAIALVAFGASVVWLSESAKLSSVARCLDILARTGGSEFDPGQLPALLSALGSDHPLARPLMQLRDTAVSADDRLTQAEHQRMRSEVRSQRFSRECDQLTEILNGLSDPVLAVDHFGDLMLANTAAELLFGFSQIAPDQEGGQSRQGMNSFGCEPLRALLGDVLRRKTSTQRRSELELADGEGQKHWYSLTCRSIAAKLGDSPSSEHGAVAVLRDITSQRAVQQRHAEFVAAVSHEMKTPLSGIKAYVELLLDGDAADDTVRDEFLGVINSQADRLRRLIDNLLNLSRIEAGVVEVHKRTLSLNELVEQALGVVQLTASEKSIELVRDCSELYLGVHADHDMLLQAAINLLSNAIKYTPRGGKVTIRTRVSDATVELDVSDTGVGLSPEDQSKVFEKFYRVKKDSQMAQGTGLGLPLARHIVEDVHGGRLTVESQLGAGSTFRIALPAFGARLEAPVEAAADPVAT